MNTSPFHILFLCTGNSARSILAEYYTNHIGLGRIRAFSAGSTPTGRVNPHALATLQAHGIDAAAGRSKSWDEFAGDSAPQMDLVVTVCDNAAGEVCPVWPGAPMREHCSFADPARDMGSEAAQRAEFERVFAEIRAYVDALLKRLADRA